MSEATVVEQLGKYGSWMEGQSAGSLTAPRSVPADARLDEIEFLDLSGLKPVSPGECPSSDDSTNTRIPSVPVSPVPVSAVRVPAVQVPDNWASANLASSVAAAAAPGSGTISTSEVVTGGRSARRTKILALAAGLVLLVGGGLFLRDGGGSDVGGADSADRQVLDVEDVDAIDFEQAESGKILDLADLSAEQQRFVLEGEIVLSGNPLIVSAPLGPEPLFDTSELGTEVVFEPLLQVTAETKPMIRGATGGSYLDGGTLVKATLLGTFDGIPWVLVVRDGEYPEGATDGEVDSNFREAFVASSYGGGGSGDFVDRDSLEMIARPEASRVAGWIVSSIGYPTGGMETVILPAATSVVTFSDSNSSQWMRPRGGFARFEAQFDDGERYTIEALDETGQVIATQSEVVRYASDSEATNPKPGDKFGVMTGVDVETGETLSVGGASAEDGSLVGAGRPTLLVYGAEWCVPCGEGIGDLVDILGDWDDVAEVYSVPHYVYSGERWPLDSSWSYPQFDPDNSSGAASVGYVPAVLVLDADGTVLDLISGLDGWGELDDRLREHLGS